MNILYLADPNSIHDIKWIVPFINKYNCYLLVRKHHYENYSSEVLSTPDGVVPIVGVIEDVSTFWYWKNKKGFKAITSLIKDYRIDLFHIMYAEPNALWALWRKEIGVPIILTTRGTDILYSIPRFLKSKGLIGKMIVRNYRKSFSNIEFFTCTSKKQKEALSFFMNKDRHIDIQIVRTGIDVDKINSQLAKSKYLMADEQFVLMPRNMKKIYNHELIVESLNYLPVDIKRKYTFVFLNADAPDQEYVSEIRELANSSGCKFHFLPTLSERELWGHLKLASAVVMTPISDGTPVTALEAMCCGAPLILGPLDYDDDLFGQGVYRLRSWSAQELAQLLFKVLSSDTRMDCETAMEKARLLGNRQNEMDKIKTIYNKLLLVDRSGL